MRFYRFESDGSSHLGVGSSDGKQVLDLTAVAPELPKNPLEFVAESEPGAASYPNRKSNWSFASIG